MENQTVNTIFLKNASQIVTPEGKHAVWGNKMNQVKIFYNSSLYIENGIIKAIGDIKEPANTCEVIDCSGKTVLPGFIDSHTHFIFGGYREKEFSWRLQGKSYMDIMKRGGGIANTVQYTRNASLEELLCSGRAHLDQMLAFGLTTIEGKSGYGLNKETELKQLDAMRILTQHHSVDIVRTFLGAHAVPKEYEQNPDEYIALLIEDILPVIVNKKMAEYCDVFCEEGVFSVAESKQILLAAKKLGMKLKIHADEIKESGGGELAAVLHTASADHLLHVSDPEIQHMIHSGVICTLLPMTAFCLQEAYAPARKIIDMGGAVALASDFNPGSCCSDSIPLLIALSVIYMHMSIEEVITAITLNGAAAIGRADTVGSIEVGKQGDIVILKYPSYEYLPYFTGVNIVDIVIKNGTLVFSANEDFRKRFATI